VLTLFCLPKAFEGRNAFHQRIALASWTRLDPKPEILVMGSDPGVAEAAAEIGARHVPDIARNEHGTPLVDSIFEHAQRLASHDLLCYVNADIVLMSDFLPALRLVAKAKHRFVMGGQRRDLDLPDDWSMDAADWEESLRALANEHGQLHGPRGIDYFAFRRHLYRKVLPFAIGRTAWDNWLIFDAWRRGAALVDATSSVMAVHLNHDFSHARGYDWVWKGPEAVRNSELAGKGLFTLDDASHVLRDGRLVDINHHRMPGERLDRVALRHPLLGPPLRLLRAGWRILRGLRGGTEGSDPRQPESRERG
jgi:hypothetical protein